MKKNDEPLWFKIIQWTLLALALISIAYAVVVGL